MKKAGIAAIAGGETPGPIPNPEDKPARVPCCTELRERSGSRDCCYARFHYFFLKFKAWQITGENGEDSGI